MLVMNDNGGDIRYVPEMFLINREWINESVKCVIVD